MPILQQANPTYFDDPSTTNKSPPMPPGNGEIHYRLPPKPVPIRQGGRGNAPRNRMESSTSNGSEGESDVFINSSTDESTISRSQIPISRNYRSYRHCDRFKRNSPLPASVPPAQRKESPGTGSGPTTTFGKITKFLQWNKSSNGNSSKNSVSSICTSTSGSSNSSGIGSPTPTPPPDPSNLSSNLSIYTNSLDSDSHSSQDSNPTHSHNGQQLSPFYSNQDNQKYNSFDDCGRFAVNTYYNVGVGTAPRTNKSSTSYRPRINSSPILPLRRLENVTSNGSGSGTAGSGSASTYYNTNFLTFRNPRRHSVDSYANVDKNLPPDSRGRDGYLVPIQTKNSTASFRRNNNRFSSNLYANDEAIELQSTANRKLNLVEVEVHSPFTSRTSSFASSTSDNNFVQQNKTHQQQQQQSSSNDSSSTLVLYEGQNTNSQGTTISKTSTNCNNNKIRNRFNFSTSSLPGGGTGAGDSSECERYCVLCTSSIGLTSPPYSGSKSSRMEVAIVSCRECFFTQRAEGHIKKFFENILTSEGQKLDVVLQTYDIKEIDHHTTAAQVHRAKIQIVIISHHFLERLKHESNVRKKVSPLNRVLRSKRVIAILLSVSETEVLDGYQQFLLNFPEWNILELHSTSRLDLEFTRKFTEIVIKIYSVEQNHLPHFTIFPKKITQDQSKVILLFKKPIESGDRVQIRLNRGRQKEHLQLLDVVGNGNNEIHQNNPYSLTVTIPASLISEKTSLIEISVFINDHKVGTKLVKYEHSKLVNEDVIQKMILAVPGFSKVLDDHISTQLSKSFRSFTDYTLEPALELMNDTLVSKVEIFPTPMHFAAYYGLEQTVCILLYESDGLEQCSVRNDSSETPEDLAISRGYESTIGQVIKDFNEVTNTFGAYKYMKDLYERHSEELEELMIDGDENLTSENQSESNSSSSPVIVGAASETNYIEVVVDDHRPENSAEEEPKLSEADSPTPTPTPQLQHLDVPVPTFRNKQTQQNYYTYENVSIPKGSGTPEIITSNSRAALLPTYDIPPNPIVVKPNSPPKPAAMNYYDMPRLMQQDYCIPPMEAKPVLPEKLPPPPIGPVFMKKSDGNIVNDQDGYIDVMGEHPGSVVLPPSSSAKNLPNSHNPKYPPVVPAAVTSTPITTGLSKRGFLNHKAGAGELTKQYSLCPSQEELLELMNDFKNNVYNMRELELLYANWQMRLDVQRDFKVRQKELKEIQKEYKKIQERIRKESKKRESPIERLMKFMPGSKKKISNAGIPGGATSNGKVISSPSPFEEPIRKVSGSSDRCSTLSGGSGSLPDSGVSEPDSQQSEKASNDRRLVATPTYVGPSEVDNSVPTGAIATPPPRPEKKSSMSPGTPEIEKDNPQVFTSPSAAPPPPPRKNSNSPFSYIDYKSRSRDLHKFVQSTKSPPTPPATNKSRKPYENQNDIKMQP